MNEWVDQYAPMWKALFEQEPSIKKIASTQEGKHWNEEADGSITIPPGAADTFASEIIQNFGPFVMTKDIMARLKVSAVDDEPQPIGSADKIRNGFDGVCIESAGQVDCGRRH